MPEKQAPHRKMGKRFEVALCPRREIEVATGCNVQEKICTLTKIFTRVRMNGRESSCLYAHHRNEKIEQDRDA